MTRRILALSAATLGLTASVAAHASPAGAFINGRHWMCDGSLDSIDVVDNILPYKLSFGANAGADGTFNDTAFVRYELDSVDYISAYTTTGYLFDNDTDGAGLYLSDVVLDGRNSDSLNDTVLRWANRFTLNLHAVANPAGDEYAYHLEGQRISEEGSVNDLSCHVYIVDTASPAS